MPTVLLLPDSALLVPGVGGALADPLGAARDAVLTALAVSGAPDVSATSGGLGAQAAGSVLVIAPGGQDRVLTGPFGDGLAAAGIGDGSPGDGVAVPGAARSAVVRAGAARAGVAAATALHLLRLAGHDPDRSATVLETSRDQGRIAAVLPASPEVPSSPELVLVVGSLSARHGPDAPLPDDPAARDADAALLAAVAEGPRAVATAFQGLSVADCDRLAITAGRPWRVLLSLLAGAGAGAGALPEAEADLLWSGVPGGAQHLVARWQIEAAA
ncbi:hypothetical protein [Cellulomonas sp. NPDC089187]|uniref:hypothetical protein n=1 Tax=Cellulomonas sp. NPDC089187 TaxID=3154970 RepID=UPI00342E8DA5